MTVVDFPQAEPKDPLQRLVRLARVRTDQTICVAGPDSLEVMAALCRAGYDRVECARRSTCAGADEVSDLLILTGSAETLGGLCARTAPLLRDGGVVAAWIGRVEDDAAIRAALLVYGLEITSSTLDVEGGLIALHRVWRARSQAKAG